jgi:hypothetical protein
MHGRKPERVQSRDLGLRDAAILTPFVACIVALAFYPQLILHRTNGSATVASESPYLPGIAERIGNVDASQVQTLPQPQP